MHMKVMSRLAMLRRFAHKFGPYLMLEILLPGGTLLALVLFLCQRMRAIGGGDAPRIARSVTRALVFMREESIFELQPCYVRPSHAVHYRVRDGIDSIDASATPALSSQS
jgi:hypothetical protein